MKKSKYPSKEDKERGMKHKENIACEKYNIKINPFFDKTLMPRAADMNLYVPFGPLETLNSYILDILEDSPRIVCLCGDRGIGKSTLLNKLYYEFTKKIKKDSPIIVKIMLRRTAVPGNLIKESLRLLKFTVGARKVVTKEKLKKIGKIAASLGSSFLEKKTGLNPKKAIEAEFKTEKDPEQELSEIYSEILKKVRGIVFLIDSYDPLNIEVLQSLLDEIQLLLVQKERRIGGIIVANKVVYEMVKYKQEDFSAVFNEFEYIPELSPEDNIETVKKILQIRAEEKRCEKDRSVKLPLNQETVELIIKSFPSVRGILLECSRLWHYCLEPEVKEINIEVYKGITSKVKIKRMDQQILKIIEKQKKVYTHDLAKEMGKDRTDVSRHLNSLFDWGFLKKEKDQRKVYYSLSPLGKMLSRKYK